MKGFTWEFPEAELEAHGPASMEQEAQQESWHLHRLTEVLVERARAVPQMLVRDLERVEHPG